MLHSLPPELLCLIFASTCDDEYYWEFQQATLRSLSLVCRLFRPIAQEILFNHVDVGKREHLDNALNWLESRKGSVQVYKLGIRFYNESDHNFDGNIFERIVKVCPNLQEFSFEGARGKITDLSLLTGLKSQYMLNHSKLERLTNSFSHRSDLQTLHLLDGDYVLSSSSPFEALVHFNLDANSGSSGNLLNPTSFPSLTTLYLELGSPIEHPEGLEQLLPQLRLIAVAVHLYARSPIGLFEPILPRLLAAQRFPKFTESYLSPDFYHLRLAGFETHEDLDPDLVSGLNLFINRLSQNVWPRLRSIHLEDWLKPDLEVGEDDLGEVARRLLEAARKKRIFDSDSRFC